MARRKELDPGEVEIAYFPDENERRTVTRRIETVDVPGAGEQGFEVTDVGDLVVWVDDAPDDIEDGSGHFELWDEAIHGPYQPTVRADVEPQADESQEADES